MRFNSTIACFCATGSLFVTLAVPIVQSKTGTSTTRCGLPTSVQTATPESAFMLRQNCDEEPAVTSPPLVLAQPIYVQRAPQPSGDASWIAYDGVPTASAMPPVQPLDNAPNDKFGSRAMLAVFVVLGLVILIVIVWACVAHRNGLHPFARFGHCTGRKNNAATARSGSAASDLSLAGAGRHYDCRPCSVQLQQQPMPQPQRPCQHSNRSHVAPWLIQNGHADSDGYQDVGIDKEFP